MSMPILVIVPGLGNSGEDHWQAHWERKYPGAIRVQQQNWNQPDRADWIQALHDTIRQVASPVVLVAHSLACALVATWATHLNSKNVSGSVVAALLVSPADVDSAAHTPAEAHVFAPMPMQKLPFPSLVILSEDDPYVEPDRARAFAASWGADCISIGNAGHINGQSGLADWSVGQSYLQTLISR